MAQHHRNQKLNFWLTPNGERLYIPNGLQHRDVVENLGISQSQALAAGFIRISSFFGGLAIEAIEVAKISDKAFSELCLFATEFPQFANKIREYLSS